MCYLLEAGGVWEATWLFCQWASLTRVNLLLVVWPNHFLRQKIEERKKYMNSNNESMYFPSNFPKLNICRDKLRLSFSVLRVQSHSGLSIPCTSKELSMLMECWFINIIFVVCLFRKAVIDLTFPIEYPKNKNKKIYICCKWKIWILLLSTLACFFFFNQI